MPVVGVAMLPVAPGSTNSPAASIISRLSHLYPSEAHETYHVDHRLFLNTSSLLPGANQKDRAFTQILTTSHNPSTTFVTTLAAATSSPATITIPTSSQDAFTQLLISKFQPLWAHRQSLSVEGIHLRLPLQDSDTWRISLGDLRIAGGSGRSAGASNVGNIRGVLIEVQYTPEDETNGTMSTGDEKRYEILFRDLLKTIVHSVGDYKMEDLRFITTKTDKVDSAASQEDKVALCKIYTELFRSSRS